jgi:predicted kinase
MSNTTSVISTDDMIDKAAADRGITYSEVFNMLDMKELTKIAFEEYTNAIKSGHDIIIDRTNMTVKSRGRFLSMVPKDYVRVGIDFLISDEELTTRLKKRADETGKYIPYSVVKSMRDSHEPPQPGEFDQCMSYFNGELKFTAQQTTQG